MTDVYQTLEETDQVNLRTFVTTLNLPDRRIAFQDLNSRTSLVDLLNERERRACELKYEAGLSEVEILSEMGIGQSTLRNAILSARQKFRDLLPAEDLEDSSEAA